MKKFKELVQELTTAQRIRRSITSKKSARKAAIARARSLKKPPTPEKVMKALDRQLRQKAFAIADKQGQYKKVVWTKKLKPAVKKAMKDAYKSRVGSKNPESE